MLSSCYVRRDCYQVCRITPRNMHAICVFIHSRALLAVSEQSSCSTEFVLPSCYSCMSSGVLYSVLGTYCCLYPRVRAVECRWKSLAETTRILCLSLRRILRASVELFCETNLFSSLASHAAVVQQGEGSAQVFRKERCSEGGSSHRATTRYPGKQ